jgi:hypothetical protein
MAPWKLTVRHGSRVEQQQLDTLDEAVMALRERMDDLAASPPRKAVEVFSRRFEPVSQVAARGELAGPGRARGGVDLRGDGSTEAFAGRWRRTVLATSPGETPYDALLRELSR